MTSSDTTALVQIMLSPQGSTHSTLGRYADRIQPWRRGHRQGTAPSKPWGPCDSPDRRGPPPPSEDRVGAGSCLCWCLRSAGPEGATRYSELPGCATAAFGRPCSAQRSRWWSVWGKVVHVRRRTKAIDHNSNLSGAPLSLMTLLNQSNLSTFMTIACTEPDKQ